jgi:uncharacterized protein (TIGR03790 family)
MQLPNLNPINGTRRVFRLHFWLGVLLSVLVAAPTTLADGKEVVVIYNKRLKESEDVARYYAEKRAVPANQLIGFEFQDSWGMSRKDYLSFVEDFLIKELESRGLARFGRDLVSATADKPGRVKYRLHEAGFRYFLMSYGVPFRIAEAPDLVEDMANLPAQMHRNGACLDNEIALLPLHGSLRFAGPIRNARFSSTNAAFLNPTNGAIIVSRLDGPTPEMARGLVDKALTAEREGLWGRAYFDLRNITSGSYAPGDTWITNCSTVARDVGFETVVDNAPGVFNNAFPMSQIALYFGWYEGTVTGPFALPSVEFAPGAIAYHLHSYSAASPRSVNQNWVGPFIAKGAAFTMGCTDEPYLGFTPQVDIFLECVAKLGFTAGEASLNCQPVLSWQTIVIGDPLYRPFGKNILQWTEELQARRSPLLEWAELQKVNIHLRNGRDPVILREYLAQLPQAETSAVLCEKVADLFADKGNFKQAIAWERKAVRNGGTPQQRVRLMRNLADWQRIFDQPADALETLNQFAVEFPGHPDMLNVRKEQLNLARDLDRADDVKRFKEEVIRLTPPPPTNAPAGNTSK